jgi:hypothetical protein
LRQQRPSSRSCFRPFAGVDSPIAGGIFDNPETAEKLQRLAQDDDSAPKPPRGDIWLAIQARVGGVGP